MSIFLKKSCKSFDGPTIFINHVLCLDRAYGVPGSYWKEDHNTILLIRYNVNVSIPILRIHRRHTKVHKYPQYNSVRHLSNPTIIQRHGYNGISL